MIDVGWGLTRRGMGGIRFTWRMQGDGGKGEIEYNGLKAAKYKVVFVIGG
jgi:hypothetical protein